MDYKAERKSIIEPLKEKLEAADSVLAMWEMGGISFGRVDEWSDIDIILIVQDGAVDEAFAITEDVLEDIRGIESKFRLPEPTPHGHSQCFFKLKDTSPYLLVDMAIIQEGSERDRFLQYAIHGRPVVHFDKNGLVKDEGLDIEKFAARIMKRVEMQKAWCPMTEVFPQKELNRGNSMDALEFYHYSGLRPLVEALRMKHDPARFNFHTRYARYDLPPEVCERLEKLAFVSGPEEIPEKMKEAREWFWEVLESIDKAELKKKLESY